MKPGLREAVEGLWYGTSAAARAGRAALAPLSAVFGAAATARLALYRSGLVATKRAPAPVVSVGALTVGGAGKTPFVLWLAAALRERGVSPCIVTRGYRRDQASAEPLLIDAAGIDPASPEAVVARAGDEAVMMALRSGCPVAVGRDRTAACEAAARTLAAAGRRVDLFLLDDGFQHLALARDLDIVLVGGDEDSLSTLPAGPLRERPSALARADVVVTRVDGPRAGEGGSALSRGAAAGRGTWSLRASFRPSAVVASVADAGGEGLSTLASRRVVAVAGIARPGRFLADLEEAGARVVARVLRGDHHAYDDDDLGEILEASRSADLVVTTEKDLVKLAGRCGATPLVALRVEVQVEDEGRLAARAAALASRPAPV